MVEAEQKNITFKTDTGSGRKRKYTITGHRDLEYVSISDKQEGPFSIDTSLELLMYQAREKGYQLITKTSTGTYYLKCHLEDVDRMVLIKTLDRNYFLGHKPRSTSYLLPPP